MNNFVVSVDEIFQAHFRGEINRTVGVVPGRHANGFARGHGLGENPYHPSANLNPTCGNPGPCDSARHPGALGDQSIQTVPVVLLRNRPLQGCVHEIATYHTAANAANTNPKSILVYSCPAERALG